MITFFPEEFSADEADVLSRHFTNLDRPVFAVTNLPEVVTAALFSRFARSNKSLRRLFLDEFVSDLDERDVADVNGSMDPERVRQLYDKSFTDYGHESVAQLGGIHVACEQSSNLLTKILERGRLASYVEQSTRYVAYDSRSRGRYRFLRDPEIVGSKHGAFYVGEMDRLFDIYSDLLLPMGEYYRSRFPKGAADSDVVQRQMLRTKVLDSLRGILPAATLSNVGIFGSAQAFEQMLIRLDSHYLPEARDCGQMMHQELSKVVPSFVRQLGTSDGTTSRTEWTSETRRRMERIAYELFDDVETKPVSGPSVELVDWDPEGEIKVIAAMLYEYVDLADWELLQRVQNMTSDERDRIVQAYASDRPSRRHKPGRALERTSYRFDIVSDYGAFRDLQRHRMLTIEWQRLSTQYGYSIPDDVTDAKCGAQFVEAMDCSAALHDRLAGEFPDRAAYAVSLAYYMRYVIELNARAATHVLELRSGPAGHPNYRPIVQSMHDQIANVAGHHRIAHMMSFVDHDERV